MPNDTNDFNVVFPAINQPKPFELINTLNRGNALPATSEAPKSTRRKRLEAVAYLPQNSGNYGTMAIGDNKENFVNRALLQFENSTELSDTCFDMINDLELETATKESFINSIKEPISEFTPQDIEEVNKYLIDAPGGDLNKATSVMTKNIKGITTGDMTKVLKEVHNQGINANGTTAQNLINIINNCTQTLVQNSTLSPTEAKAPAENENPFMKGLIGGGTIISFIGIVSLIACGIKKCRNRSAVNPEQDEQPSSINLTIENSQYNNELVIPSPSITPLNANGLNGEVLLKDIPFTPSQTSQTR